MPIDQVAEGQAGAAEALTIDNTTGGVGFTAATIAVGHVRAGTARFRLETAQVRYTVDGTAPTTTVGTIVNIGEEVWIRGAANVAAFRAIRTGGSSGEAFVTYYREPADTTVQTSRLLHVDFTDVGNVGVGEDTLMSYTVPANTLAVNGDSLRFHASGTAANNANAKTVKVYFGATLIWSLALGANSAKAWYVTGVLVRSGVGGQLASCFGNDAPAAGGSGTEYATYGHITPAEDETAGVLLKVTGEATADNDIVQKAIIVEKI